MDSRPNLRSINPDAVLAARADERLSHAYEQIARADEQLERVTEQLSKMEHGAARQPSAVLRRPAARGRPALRGLAGLVLAGAIGAVAFASQTSYGKTLAQWAPHLVSTSSLWLAKPASFAQPGVRLAAAEALSPQPTPQAQTLTQTQVQTQVESAAQDAVSAPVPAPSELAQLVQGMARDLATVELGIEQLKASQERMAADNARVMEQLKANQEQMARLVVKPPPAKPVQQDLRAKTPAPLPKPVANAAHKPPPTQPSQARARPQPVQLVPEER
jgi:predicted FMN-binding regulatory protein PaiB